MSETWKLLFRRALTHMENAGIPTSDWAFGGGTVLMFAFNHRESKDIDIFFSKPQRFDRLSPQNNKTFEAILLDSKEHFQHIRLWFKEGEIDFVLTLPVTKIQPVPTKVLDMVVNLDHPVEIVAKKIYHRAPTFQPRDVFDLAVVYGAFRKELLEHAEIFAKELSIVAHNLDEMEHSGSFENAMKQYTILPGGEHVRGREIALCRQFVTDAFQTLDNVWRENMLDSKMNLEASNEPEREEEETKHVLTGSSDNGMGS